MAALSKERVYSHLLVRTAGSKPVEAMDVFLLSDGGLCDWPVTRPEKSYRMWCVIVCDLDTSQNEGTWPALGLLRQS